MPNLDKKIFNAIYSDRPDNPQLDVLKNIFKCNKVIFKAGVESPLHIAAFQGKAQCLEFLVQQADLHQFSLDTKNADGDTPLKIALQNNRKDCVQVLLKYGASLLAVTQHRKDIFYVAKLWQRDDLVQMVDNMSYDFFAEVAQGSQSLQRAKVLLEKGHRINAKNVDKYTPLFAVAEVNNYRLVCLLLKNNADLYAKDYLGRTVLNFIDEESVTYLYLSFVMNSLRDDNDAFTAQLLDTVSKIDDDEEKLKFMDCVSVAIKYDFAKNYTEKAGSVLITWALSLNQHPLNKSQKEQLDSVRELYREVVKQNPQLPFDRESSPTINIHDNPYKIFSKGETKTRERMDELPNPRAEVDQRLDF